MQNNQITNFQISFLNEYKKNIYFIEKPRSIGGPASFQSRFEKKLSEHGYSILYSNNRLYSNFSTLFIIGGTKKFLAH